MRNRWSHSTAPRAVSVIFIVALRLSNSSTRRAGGSETVLQLRLALRLRWRDLKVSDRQAIPVVVHAEGSDHITTVAAPGILPRVQPPAAQDVGEGAGDLTIGQDQSEGVGACDQAGIDEHQLENPIESRDSVYPHRA